MGRGSVIFLGCNSGFLAGRKAFSLLPDPLLSLNSTLRGLNLLQELSFFLIFAVCASDKLQY